MAGAINGQSSCQISGCRVHSTAQILQRLYAIWRQPNRGHVHQIHVTYIEPNQIHSTEQKNRRTHLLVHS